MRARRRRSVLNTVSAAVLEVAIMGLFVIIAQPQLRDALFEILHAGEPVPTQARSQAGNRQGAVATTAATLDQTLQAVASSPVGQAIEHSLAQWANGSRPESNVPSLSTQQPTAPSLLSSTPAPMPASGLRDQLVPEQMTAVSPYEQYESFRVSVPTSNSSAFQQPAHHNYGSASAQTYAVPQYVSPQSYGAQNDGAQAYGSQAYSSQAYGGQAYGAQNYTTQNYGQGSMQNYAPTQLHANQWNIASAAQSPRPNANANTNHWIPSQVTETSFRQVYPPPYGTQSMWK